MGTEGLANTASHLGRFTLQSQHHFTPGDLPHPGTGCFYKFPICPYPVERRAPRKKDLSEVDLVLSPIRGGQKWDDSYAKRDSS